MHITDPIADMLTRIRNANNAKHDTVDIPASNMKKAIAQILVDEGYIKAFQLVEDGTQGVIHVTLKYNNPGKEKVISGLRRVSKPGLRVYAGADELPRVLRGLGVAIVSTSKGVMTDKAARAAHVGGEVLAFVWSGGEVTMSRIGRMPISLPSNVEVTLGEGNLVTVKGPKGTLTQKLSDKMTITKEENVIHVTRPNDAKENRALHGLTRTLLNNMVVGVTEGYKKELDVNGVGYRVAKEGKKLNMNIGYSHPVIVEEIDGITIDVPSPNKIVISGTDKQKVGQFAAEVRGKRPPEPYKGKGIKYTDEVIRRKEGKTGVKK